MANYHSGKPMVRSAESLRLCFRGDARSIRPPASRATVVYDLDSALRLSPHWTRSRQRVRYGGLSVWRPTPGWPTRFARVAPSKDYETLIRAANQLLPHHPKLLFLMVGDYSSAPEYYEHLQHLLAQAGIANRFLFTGFRSDARRLMMASNVCLLSTNWKGLPLVLVGAMEAGRPAHRHGHRRRA